MRKKITSLFLILLLTMVMVVPVFGTTVPGTVYVLDEVDVLTAEEETEMMGIAQEIEQSSGIRVFYHCVESTGEFDNAGYARGFAEAIGGECVVLVDNQGLGKIYIELFGSVNDLVPTNFGSTTLDLYNEDETYYGGVKAYYEAAAAHLIQTGVLSGGQTTEPEPEAGAMPEDGQLPRLVDDADILTDSEEAEILGVLNEISERQKFDVVIATVDDFEQSDVKKAAYDYYDYNGFGYGDDKDGVLLYLSMGERDMNIAGTGFGIQAFTDFGREQLIEQIKPELGEDDFYGAFMEYAELCDDYVTQAKTGEPYDVDNPAIEESFTDKLIKAGGAFLLFLVIGFVIAKIIVGSAKKQLISVEEAVHADSYVKDGSMQLTRNTDYFLYSHIESRYNPKKDDDGGSTIDFGSSGTAHSSTSSKF